MDPKGNPAVEDQADFIGIVSAFQNASPVPFADNLLLDHADDTVVDARALRFYYATYGVIGYVAKLFKKALRLVIRSPEGHQSIDLELREKAYAEAFRFRQKGMANPFTKEWSPVNQIGAPNLPPPLKDDSVLLHHKMRRQTKGDKARNVRMALSAR